jgi:hypothetical protein
MSSVLEQPPAVLAGADPIPVLTQPASAIKRQSALSRETGLLSSVAQNLRSSVTDQELGQQVIEWMSRRVPATGFAVYYLPVNSDGAASFRHKARLHPLFVQKN